MATPMSRISASSAPWAAISEEAKAFTWLKLLAIQTAHSQDCYRSDDYNGDGGGVGGVGGDGGGDGDGDGDGDEYGDDGDGNAGGDGDGD
eukprot:4604499-Alexandrium_andersonii.AAC.1